MTYRAICIDGPREGDVLHVDAYLPDQWLEHEGKRYRYRAALDFGGRLLKDRRGNVMYRLHHIKG